MGLALLSEVSLGCSSYEHWHRVARGFYVDGLGAIEAPSGADGGGDIRINVGASQLHLVKETSERIQTLDGYVELWTREPLQELGARLHTQWEIITPFLHGHECEEIKLLSDNSGLRLLCRCPFGTLIIVRLAPPNYFPYAHGEVPGGFGKIVALTRLVHKVAPQQVQQLWTFWTQTLGARGGDGPIQRADGLSHCTIHFASGQQLIYDERATEADDGQRAIGRHCICVYADTLDTFEQMFHACEDRGALGSHTGGATQGWEEACATGEFALRGPDAGHQGVNGSGEDHGGAIMMRSVAHAACPLPRADIVKGGAVVSVPAAFANCSPLKPPPHAKPGMIRIPHGKGGFGDAARSLASRKQQQQSDQQQSKPQQQRPPQQRLQQRPQQRPPRS